MSLRSVRCAWCMKPLQIGVPELDGAYYHLLRRCRACDGNNRVELEEQRIWAARSPRGRRSAPAERPPSQPRS